MVKQLTEKRLYNITLFYLSKYEASSEKVRQMLNRRLMKMRLKGEDIPDSVTDWIEQVIQKMVSAGYINDQRYAENQMRILSAQGKSNRFIVGKLQQAGIVSETVADLLNQSEESESERARHFAKKKKIGPFRPAAQRLEYRQKDMATLARAGFSYDIVCEVLNQDD